MYTYEPNPDIEIDNNNGVTAVAVVRNGRLASLIKETCDHKVQVWLFSNVAEVEDDTGFSVVDHITRGVMTGNRDDLAQFLKLCERLGVKIRRGSLYVPCSNGHLRHGIFRDRFGSGDRFSDFTDEELRMVRVDLPTEQQLMTALSK